MGVELPEALLLANQMNNELKGKAIEGASLMNCASLLRMGFINVPPEEFETRVRKRTIQEVTGKGKWVFTRLIPLMNLLFAPEMGGRILFHRDDRTLPGKFHLKLDFGDHSYLTVSISGVGFILALTDDEMSARKYPGTLGVSPIDEEQFTLQKFISILQSGLKKPVKSVLLNQWSIAGIGNGYLQDILFKAKIHPKRKASELNEKEKLALYTAIKETMNEAVRLGGSESEYDLYNKPGHYKRVMDEHTKSKPCPRCGKLIEKLSVLGSAAYVCSSCQK